jgi:DnaJ-class molecular chaperone
MSERFPNNSEQQKPNYYEILGVPQDASQEEIKSAFRKQASRWHPDRNPGNADAEEKFKNITEANTVLSDEAQRREYDYSIPAAETHNDNELPGAGSIIKRQPSRSRPQGWSRGYQPDVQPQNMEELGNMYDIIEGRRDIGENIDSLRKTIEGLPGSKPSLPNSSEANQKRLEQLKREILGPGN